MKTVVLTDYGPPDVLRLQERPRPEPKGRRILVRVHATSVNYGDLFVRDVLRIGKGGFNMPGPLWPLVKLSLGWKQPRVTVLGSEFSGVVEEVGPQATRFRPGDEVFGYLGQSMGAYAECVLVSEDACVAPKPAGLRHEEAATLPYGAVMALHLLRKAGLAAGQSVLVVGASGSIGAAAVQIARHAGARVDGVCGAPRAAFVRSLGAQRVFDYATEDFVGSGGCWDLVFDVLGRVPFDRCRQALSSDGVQLCASFKTPALLRSRLPFRGAGPRLLCAMAPGSREDLLAACELVDAGALRSRPCASFPLEEAAAAHRFVEEGRAAGPVALVVAS